MAKTRRGITTPAGERLFHLRQETRSAQDFALEFRTLATGAGWNDRALTDHYCCSLREDVLRVLPCRDTTLSLDELIDMSIRLDKLLAARGRPERALLIPPPGPPAPIPMELGGPHRGGPEEEAPPAPGVVGEDTLPIGAGGARLGVGMAGRALHIYFPGFSPSLQHKALDDSGAAGNFMDCGLALRLGIPLVALDLPFPMLS